jgi:hypothetical protein
LEVKDVDTELKLKYESEGFAQESVGAIITLVMGMTVATLLLIFSGVLGGQVYSTTYTDLIKINTTDPTTFGYIQGAIQKGFYAQNVTATYLPLIALAIIITIVMVMVMTMGNASSTEYRGGAL